MGVRWLMGVRTGQRVQVARDLDFLPFFKLKAGQTGTVHFVNDERGNCSVKMDDPIDGCEQWDNEVYFNLEGASMPHEEWYTLQDVSWPLPTFKEGD